MDQQCNLTNGLLKKNPRHTIYDTFKKEIDALPIEEINDNLHLIAASTRLNSLELELASIVSRDRLLSGFLKPYKGSYDFVLIDCPPSKSCMVVNALTASNYALIPAEPDPFAYKGVVAITELIEEVKDFLNTELKTL